MFLSPHPPPFGVCVFFSILTGCLLPARSVYSTKRRLKWAGNGPSLNADDAVTATKKVFRGRSFSLSLSPSLLDTGAFTPLPLARASAQTHSPRTPWGGRRGAGGAASPRIRGV